MTKISDLGITEDGTYLLSNDGKAYPVEMNTGYVVGVLALGSEAMVPRGLFGRWTDIPRDGGPEVTYWDAVEFIDDLHEALDRARAGGEVAIWDNANQVEIRV